MKIHLQSDTHIETGMPLPPAVASNVAACVGDIGLLVKPEQLVKYFDAVRETTDHIIWLLGNHEFYHSEYFRVLDEAAEFAQKHNIHLLDEALGTAHLEIDGVTFWGSTLWTDLKDGDYFVKKTIGNGLNDYHVTAFNKDGKSRRMTVDDTIEINKRTREQINWGADVVLTHHCPLTIKHKLYPMDNVTYGFCNTGLEDQIAASNIKYWMYGHTHDSCNTDVNGTSVISNQHGYSKMNWHTGKSEPSENCDFDPHLILEVNK